MRHSIIGLVTVSLALSLVMVSPVEAQDPLVSKPQAEKTACETETDCEETTAPPDRPIPDPAVSWGQLLGSLLHTAPKFKAEVAVHFTSDAEPQAKVRVNVPATKSILVGDRSIQKDIPTTDKPMKFSTGFEKIVDEVISCGHRICTGNKCYEVKDEPVVGENCSQTEQVAVDEPILVVPAAPPAPPPVFVAQQQLNAVSEFDQLVEGSGLEQVKLPVSAKMVVRLLVERAHLSTRLEMTEQIMSEREAAMEQIYALTDRNAQLKSQIAVAEARQQVADQLTASLVERAELAVKLVSRGQSATEECGTEYAESDSTKSIRAIQEDLSNIRRQIALMKKQQPVPFAPSSLGLPKVRPYVPTARSLAPPTTEEPSPVDETCPNRY
jgi:hypothetical protein